MRNNLREKNSTEKLNQKTFLGETLRLITNFATNIGKLVWFIITWPFLEIRAFYRYLTDTPQDLSKRRFDKTVDKLNRTIKNNLDLNVKIKPVLIAKPNASELDFGNIGAEVEELIKHIATQAKQIEYADEELELTEFIKSNLQKWFNASAPHNKKDSANFEKIIVQLTKREPSNLEQTRQIINLRELHGDYASRSNIQNEVQQNNQTPVIVKTKECHQSL